MQSAAASPLRPGTSVRRILAWPAFRSEEIELDKNRKNGAVRQVQGTIKELTGKLTGDKSQELEGKAEKNVGKAQSKVGEATDALRNIVRKDD
jgi:uncharacterized protein YjbJ (UPF0337 family)